MPIRVQLPNGSFAEFPDGMATADIEAVLARQFGAPEPPDFGNVQGGVASTEETPGYFERLGGTISKGFKRGSASTLASGLHAGADFIDQTIQAPIRGIMQPLGLMFDADPLGAARIADESMGVQREINADRQQVQQQIGGRPSLAQFAESPLNSAKQYSLHLANAGAESLPAFAGAMAMRNPQLAAGVLGGVTGAQTYTDMRADGVGRLDAARAGVANAAIEAAGESFGLPFVMGKAGRGSLMRSMLAEGVQEVPVSLAQGYVEDSTTGRVTPIAEQLGNALDAGLVGASMGAGGHGLSVGIDALSRNRAPAVTPPPATPAGPRDPWDTPPSNDLSPATISAGNAALQTPPVTPSEAVAGPLKPAAQRGEAMADAILGKAKSRRLMADPILDSAALERAGISPIVPPVERPDVFTPELYAALGIQPEPTRDLERLLPESAVPSAPPPVRLDSRPAPVAAPQNLPAPLDTQAASTAQPAEPAAQPFLPERTSGQANPLEAGRLDVAVRPEPTAAPAPVSRDVVGAQAQALTRPGDSWVLRNKETGEVIAETRDRKKVEALNTDKYEAVPAGQHLAQFNEAVKAAGGVQPAPGWNKAVAPMRAPMSVRVGGNEYPVDSYEEASRKFIQLRETVDIGGMPVVEIIDQGGNPIAYMGQGGEVYEGNFQRERLNPERKPPVYRPPRGEALPNPATIAGEAVRVAEDGYAPPPRKRFSALDMRQLVGWSQRGGLMVRAARDPSELNEDERNGIVPIPPGPVIGRTRWTGFPGPDGEESTFWKNRPKGITEGQANVAFDKFERGEPLNAKQQRFIDYAQAVAADYDDALNLLDDEARGYAAEADRLDIEALREQLDADIAEADASEAMSLADLYRELAYAGVDLGTMIPSDTETDGAYAARLWQRLNEARNGTDQRTEAGDSAQGAEGSRGRNPAAAVEQVRGSQADPAARQEVAPSAGLFGAPSARDYIDAAQRNKDAARDGKTGTGRTDMLAGDGELFAGARPEQASLAEPIGVDMTAAQGRVPMSMVSKVQSDTGFIASTMTASGGIARFQSNAKLGDWTKVSGKGREAVTTAVRIAEDGRATVTEFNGEADKTGTTRTLDSGITPDNWTKATSAFLSGLAPNAYAKYDTAAKLYGRGVTADGMILKSDGKPTSLRVREKAGRLRVESDSGKLVFSGAATGDALGKFMESYWGASKVKATSGKQVDVETKFSMPASEREANLRRWFGDSKVVDADGNPLVLYHGTSKRFSKISMRKGAQGLFWMTSDREAIERGEVGAAGKGVIMPLYAKITKPAGWDEYDRYGIGELKRDGYDGLILPDGNGSFNVVAFYPDQIKSADRNNGNFDAGDLSILRSQPADTAGSLESPEALLAELKSSPVGRSLAALERAGVLDIIHDPKQPWAGKWDGRRATLNAAQIPAGKGVGVALHELGVHAERDNLQGILGDAGFMALLATIDRWANSSDPATRDLAANVQRRVNNANTPAQHRDEERLAYAVELAANAGMQSGGEIRAFLRRFAAYVKAWLSASKLGSALRARGLNFDLTPQDVAQLAAYAVARQARAVAPSRAMQAAEAFSRPAVDQTQSEAFKRWFGRSKVVTKDGKPLRVFHGTASNIEAFSNDELGSSTGAQSAKAGHWFVADATVATGYAHYAAIDAPVRRKMKEAELAERQAQYASLAGDSEEAWRKYDEALVEAETLETELQRDRDRGQNIIPVYLSMQNPIELDAEGASYVDFQSEINRAIRKMQASQPFDGARYYDGLIIRNLDDHPTRDDLVSDHYLVREPTQIKSAIGNSGAFDPENPSILASMPDAGVEFTNGQEALESRLAQWAAALHLRGGSPRAIEASPETVGAVTRNAGGAAEQGDASRTEIREQSARLIERAKAEGFFWPDDSPILAELGKLPTLAGAEHQVFVVGEGNNRLVIRATDNGFFGHRSDISPAQYLARLDDYSRTFPSLQTRLIGVSESTDVEGHAVIWTAQTFVYGKKFKTQALLAEAMAGRGWQEDGHPGVPRFKHESGAIIEDAHTDNVFQDDNGDLYPFDVVVEALPNVRYSMPDAPAFDPATATAESIIRDGRLLSLIDAVKAANGDLSAIRQAVADRSLSALTQAIDDVLPSLRPKPQRVTGIKNAVTDAERAAAGRDPILRDAIKSNEDTLVAAMRELRDDPNAGEEVVARLTRGGEMSLADEGILLVYKTDLLNKRDAAAATLGDPDASESRKDVARQAWADTEAKIAAVDMAASAIGTEAGRMLQFRQRMLREDFTFAALERKERARLERPLTPAESATIKAMADTIAEMQAKVDALQARIANAESEGAYEDLVKRMARPSKQRPTLTSLRSKADAARARLAATQGVQSRRRQSGAVISPTAFYDLAVIGAYHVANGAAKFSDWVVAMRADIGAAFDTFKADHPNIFKASQAELEKPLKADASVAEVMEKIDLANVTSKDVRKLIEALVGEGMRGEQAVIAAAAEKLELEESDVRSLFVQTSPKPQPTLTEAQEELRDLRKLVRLQAEIDRITAGQPKPSRGPAAPDSPAVAEKKRQLAELRASLKPVRDPEGRYQEMRGKQIAKRIKEIEDRIRAGDFAARPRVPRKLNEANQRAQYELDKVKEAFLRHQFMEMLKARSKWGKALGFVGDSLNLSRALMTSLDFSGLLRQGGFVTFGHPVMGGKAFAQTLGALVSERAEHAIMSEIKARPNARLYEKHKLALTGIGFDRGGLSKIEENYASRWIDKAALANEKDGSVRHRLRLLATMPVRASGRVYVSFLNRLRADAFDALAATMSKTGVPTEAEAQHIADFVNTATGRGKIPRNWDGLNTVAFAPRLVASRFSLATFTPIITAPTDRMKAQIAKEYARTLIGVGVVMSLLAYGFGGDDENEWWESINFDPRSADFMKLRFGDTRIDPFMGLSQVAVLMARLGTGETVTSGGDLRPLRSVRTWTDLRRQFDPSIPAHEVGENGEMPFGARGLAEAVFSFIRSKANPATGAAMNFVFGQNFIGEPTTVAGEAKNLLVPMSIPSIFEAMEDQGVPRGAALGLLSLFGMSLQVHTKSNEDQLKEFEKATDALRAEVKERLSKLPQDQWQSALSAMDKEYEGVLAGVRLDTYKGDYTDAKGVFHEAGSPKVDKEGRPKLKYGRLSEGQEDEYRANAGAQPGEEAHHIIADNLVRRHKLMVHARMAGYDLNHPGNMIALPANPTGQKVGHNNDHPKYDAEVIGLLNENMKRLNREHGSLRNAPPAEVLDAVRKIEAEMRKRIEKRDVPIKDGRLATLGRAVSAA